MSPVRIAPILAAVLACVPSAWAFPVIFDNITPNEGQNYTSFTSPASLKDTGFPFDAGAADDFVLPPSSHPSGDWLVTGLTWSGLFGTGFPVPISNFRVIFWPKATETLPAGGTPSGPPDYGQALAIYENILPTETPGAGGGATFDYAADLPTPFVADDGQTYWLEIQPSFNYPPLWNWQVTYRRRLSGPVRGWDLFGLPFWSPIEDQGDLAFTLLGEPVPEPVSGFLLALVATAALQVRTRR